jgi:hypothetical protein
MSHAYRRRRRWSHWRSAGSRPRPQPDLSYAWCPAAMRQLLRLPLLSLVNHLHDKRVVGVGTLLTDIHHTLKRGPSRK